jgi:hypothetical protein
MATYFEPLTAAENSDSDAAARRIMPAVLAQNRAASLAEIVGADDAAVQTAVNAAVDVFATGV